MTATRDPRIDTGAGLGERLAALLGTTTTAKEGDAPTLVLTSGPWGHWEGYVTSGADALL